MNYRIYLLTSLFILVITGAMTQRPKYVPTSLDIVAGQQLLQNSTFGNTFATLQNPRFKTLQTIGLACTSGFQNNRREYYAGYFDYVQFIPQAVVFHDSIQARVTGFIFGMHVFGKDLLPKSCKYANLIFSIGFHTGRVRIYDNAAARQKNPFFAPSLSLAPRFLIGKLALQLRASYGFDISRKSWKNMPFREPAGVSLPNLSLTGLNLSVGVGYCF